MAVNKNNRMLATNSSLWAEFVAIVKVIIDFTGDYLSGQKYRTLNEQKQNKQK